jgi:invasion protein IalB
MARTFLAVLTLMLLAPAAYTQNAPPGTWVKVCDKGTLIGLDEDDNEKKMEVSNCVTRYEYIEPNSAVVVFSAALHHAQLGGKDRHHLKVTVPLGVLLAAGVGATVVREDTWDRVAKDRKLKGGDSVQELKLTFTDCFAWGCFANVEATPETLTNLKTGGGLIIRATSRMRTPLAMPVPLAGFADAFEGNPRDVRVIGERTLKCDPYYDAVYDAVTNDYLCGNYRRRRWSPDQLKRFGGQ